MLRARIADVDLEGGTVRIHEKKRAHGKITSRRVPLSPFLAGVLRDWLAVHPGGPYLFCQQLRVFRSKRKRTETTPISRDEATDHFKRTLDGSKWSVMRGHHALRHTFCSLCASRGADQRLINAWVGHQTEEMVKRYQHLFPHHQREAIAGVFTSPALVPAQAS
jgi:integrase